jgi:hypothetical protein
MKTNNPEITQPNLNPVDLTWLKFGLIIAFVLIMAGVWWQSWRNTNNVADQSMIDISPTLTLPSGWVEEDVEEHKTMLFHAKKEALFDNEQAAQVAVVVLQNVLGSEQDPAEYAAEMIAGAQNTLPGLKYTDSEFISQDSFDLQRLKGEYQVGDLTFGIKQQLYFVDDQVFTFSGSYPLDDSITSAEVEIIFDQVIADKKLIPPQAEITEISE